MRAPAEFANASQIMWFGDNLMTIRVPASAENDQVSIIECRIPQGDTTPLHVNLSNDEMIHVLEGTMRFCVEGNIFFLAHAGQTVMAPKGIPHDFRIESVDGATCLIVTQGSDFEQMVRQTSLPEPQAGKAPETAQDAEKVRRLVETCSNQDVEVIGAPLP